MTIQIPDRIVQDAGLDEKSVMLELALTLYTQQRLSPGQVRAMCGLGYFEFEQIAQERGLPTCFMTDEEAALELESIRKLRAK